MDFATMSCVWSDLQHWCACMASAPSGASGPVRLNHSGTLGIHLQRCNKCASGQCAHRLQCTNCGFHFKVFLPDSFTSAAKFQQMVLLTSQLSCKPNISISTAGLQLGNHMEDMRLKLELIDLASDHDLRLQSGAQHKSMPVLTTSVSF